MNHWIQTRDYDGPLYTEEWCRSDGKWVVGTNINTRSTKREAWVSEVSAQGVARSSPHFRRRFSTAEAAMAAVDKRFPL